MLRHLNADLVRHLRANHRGCKIPPPDPLQFFFSSELNLLRPPRLRIMCLRFRFRCKPIELMGLDVMGTSILGKLDIPFVEFSVAGGYINLCQKAICF